MNYCSLAAFKSLTMMFLGLSSLNLTFLEFAEILGYVDYCFSSDLGHTFNAMEGKSPLCLGLHFLPLQSCEVNQT